MFLLLMVGGIAQNFEVPKSKAHARLSPQTNMGATQLLKLSVAGPAGGTLSFCRRVTAGVKG